MYGHLITKFFRIGSLPDLLTHDAPQAGFARQSSAKNFTSQSPSGRETNDKMGAYNFLNQVLVPQIVIFSTSVVFLNASLIRLTGRVIEK